MITDEEFKQANLERLKAVSTELLDIGVDVGRRLAAYVDTNDSTYATKTARMKEMGELVSAAHQRLHTASDTILSLHLHDYKHALDKAGSSSRKDFSDMVSCRHVQEEIFGNDFVGLMSISSSSMLPSSVPK